MNIQIPSIRGFSLPLAAAPTAQLAKQAAETDIRGIRGPVEIPPVQDWQAWVLVAVAAVLAIALVAYLVHRIKRRAQLRVLDAREQALADLEKARELMAASSSRDFSYAVSDVLRGFLELRFSLPSTRRTTDEFLQSIARNRIALGPYGETLADFLKCCDLGKFGKWQLSLKEMEALHQSAVAVINAELDGPPSASLGGPSPRESSEPLSEPAKPTLETSYANP